MSKQRVTNNPDRPLIVYPITIIRVFLFSISYRQVYPLLEKI
jgi:hypothetical protein